MKYAMRIARCARYPKVKGPLSSSRRVPNLPFGVCEICHLTFRSRTRFANLSGSRNGFANDRVSNLPIALPCA